ncbi:MAG: thioredoxin fold domain-containing protein [Candidatus Thiodiazotropha sp. (ex Lucinoma aequizonata)]|nr:thioredoxin fold domain-containing protein [Candidatus Thiodiazotropha sp. (ex Lucinoma aequizonata)]MCU7889618.1 thioredoxin fold domain-containing protein [Candidatus Thiodiazotropha sp. (ex Lucinoma aequizonata)]MCU7895147.1 thioredoxin fold domain-containing protein [Candidatus Thiodiazotropha sp. (ex Lucinoma aequizonata)]MCU7899336.1 thioredoxin fold domain-containing protein [Candidatus Thiodiazotropha sp. (ex Lucinoma aequizonata)]MCU7901786.1 thioredoxin fold domain-containing prote
MACHVIGINVLKLLSRVLILNILFILSVSADPEKLIPVENIQKLAAEAKQNQIPILLLISQYHCGFCDLMKEEILQPMQLNSSYRERVLVRELLIDQGGMVTNFQGNREATADFVDQYNIFVTPTLLFLDADGKEASERIVGINTIDYLIFYIEDAIDSATANMVQK